MHRSLLLQPPLLRMQRRRYVHRAGRVVREPPCQSVRYIQDTAIHFRLMLNGKKSKCEFSTRTTNLTKTVSSCMRNYAFSKQPCQNYEA